MQTPAIPGAQAPSEHKSRFAANDNLEVEERLRDVKPEDAEEVRRTFWAKMLDSRPRLGRLSRVRGLAVDLIRLFEMLTAPGFVVPWRTTAAVVFGLAYFISSIDLIPDAIPVLGFLDDAFVIAEVMVIVAADLARFEESRRGRGRTAAAEPARGDQLDEAA